jgi:hypothetical protein
MRKLLAGMVITGLLVAAVALAQDAKGTTYTLVVNGSK